MDISAGGAVTIKRTKVTKTQAPASNHERDPVSISDSSFMITPHPGAKRDQQRGDHPEQC